MTFQIFKKQVAAMTLANLKARYRNTIAGFVWVVLNPVIMYGVQSFVFRVFLRLPVERYFLFLLSGLLPWIFVVQSLEMCTSIFQANGQLLRSFKVSPLIVLMAQVLDNFVNFLAAFVLILIPVFAIDPHHNWVGLILFPFALIFLVLGVFGLAWLLATLQVYFRDTRFLVSFGTSISFFLTPIFYPSSYIPPQYLWMVQVNPFYRLIEPFRLSLYEGNAPLFFVSAIKALVTVVILVGLAKWYWDRSQRDFYVHI